MTIDNGPLRIVASQQLGDLGSGQSTPAIVQWQRQDHLQLAGVALWALGILLVMLFRNHPKRMAWPSVLLVVLVAFLWQMEGFSILSLSLVAAWIVIWLLTPRVVDRVEVVDELPSAASSQAEQPVA